MIRFEEDFKEREERDAESQRVAGGDQQDVGDGQVVDDQVVGDGEVGVEVEQFILCAQVIEVEQVEIEKAEVVQIVQVVGVVHDPRNGGKLPLLCQRSALVFVRLPCVIPSFNTLGFTSGGEA